VSGEVRWVDGRGARVPEHERPDERRTVDALVAELVAVKARLAVVQAAKAALPGLRKQLTVARTRVLGLETERERLAAAEDAAADALVRARHAAPDERARAEEGAIAACRRRADADERLRAERRRVEELSREIRTAEDSAAGKGADYDED
jgi:hypothetical protein